MNRIFFLEHKTYNEETLRTALFVIQRLSTIFPTMDDQSAKFAAQAIDHEESTGATSTDVEEKTSSKTGASSPIHSIEQPDNNGVSEKHDVEIAQDEETPPPVKVPRSKRRGLFGRFTILAEVEEPKHYSRATKWLITFNIALAALAAPLGSAIIFREQMPPTRCCTSLIEISYPPTDIQRPAYLTYHY